MGGYKSRITSNQKGTNLRPMRKSDTTKTSKLNKTKTETPQPQEKKKKNKDHLKEKEQPNKKGSG